MSIWQQFKQDWNIKKHQIKDLGIDPDKSFEEITYKELSQLADLLDVTVSDLLN